MTDEIDKLLHRAIAQAGAATAAPLGVNVMAAALIQLSGMRRLAKAIDDSTETLLKIGEDVVEAIENSTEAQLEVGEDVVEAIEDLNKKKEKK